jgi:hypothetical protein
MDLFSLLGQGIAQNSTGATDPASLVKASTGYGAAGTLLDSTSNVLSGLGSYQLASYAAAVAKNREAAILSAGTQAEEASKMKMGAYLNEQKAAFAGQGVGLSSGSVRNTLATTASMSAFDAALLHYNAMREATEAGAESALAKRAATNQLSEDLIKADTSFLGGAQALSQKWLQYKELGAQSNSTVPF